MSKKPKKKGNTKAKLTKRQIGAIKLQLGKGVSQSALARKYGVSPQAICYHAKTVTA